MPFLCRGAGVILNRKFIFTAFIFCLCQTSGLTFPAYAKEALTPAKKPPVSNNILSTNSEDPVDLLADEVEYDEANGIVSALGNVELVQQGRILRAEKVTYNLELDKVEALGNVVLNEVTGEVYFADRVELKDKMKDGFVSGLKGVLQDGGRFTAEEGKKVADLKMVMNKASYTACEPCKLDPTKAPIWAIKAREVTHHKDEQRVSYDDATFEVAGVPVMYTPYFSHPDGSVKRKSGFLLPNVGFDSALGAVYDQAYYWDIAPDRDATFSTMLMSEQNPLVKGQYRQRFENAEIKMSGGLTYSDRTDLDNGTEFKEDNQARGHAKVDGLWNINEKWRAGTALEAVSDSQYLRQYNISNEDVLKNKVYLERFSGRDYATVQAIQFKDVRVSDRKVDQPNLLPEVYSRFLGNPNSLLGGRGSLSFSGMGLYREGDERDVNRGSVEAGWERRFVSDWGLVNKLNFSLRGDAYQINDRNQGNNLTGQSNDNSELRGFANSNFQTSYPLLKDFEKTQMVVEPLAALTVGINLTDNPDIPNEDSQDVFLDATNIFNPNRFPGYDRIEDESHATYGVRTGLYADNGYKGEVFVGQSYRFDGKDDLFPQGSGLSEQQSDWVGNVSADLGENFHINYALQLDNDTFASRRHEVDSSVKLGRLRLGTRYFYANALQGTDFTESREQIQNSARLNLTDEWSMIGGSQYDLASETEGLRRLSYGLDYQGQCVTFLINGERKLTSDSSGDSGTTIMMRLGLKNLGSFETSGFSVGQSN